MTNHTMADHVLWLSQIQPRHRHLVGESAYHLGIALQKGYPVLPSIVVSTFFFDNFLESVDWVDPLFADLPHSSLHIDVDNSHQLQAIAQRIQQSVNVQPITSDYQAPIFDAVQTLDTSLVLVRPLLVLRQSISSPTPSTHGFPNRMSIDVPHQLLTSRMCHNDETNLMLTIRQVWTSFFQASHLFYWQRLGVPFRHLQLALLIQPAVSSVASGLVQVTKDFADMSAGWGLVQGIQAGDLIPDRYLIYQDSQVTHQWIGSKRYAHALLISDQKNKNLRSHDSTSAIAPHPIGASLDPVSLHSSMPGTVEPSVEPICRHILSDQDAQQQVLPNELLLRIQQLSQNFHTIVGAPLGLEWSIHPLSPGQISPKPTLPWLNAAHKRVWSHQELVQLLEQNNCAVQVTYLFSQKQSGHITDPQTPAMPETSITEITDVDIATPKAATPTSVISVPAILGSDTSVPAVSAAPSSPPSHSAVPPSSSASTLNGLGAAGGSVVAPVWVVKDAALPMEAGPLTHHVVVTQHVTVSWFNVIRTAKGIISEQGGMTSHGAILAREVGIPAVVRVADALATLKTGDWVILNGDRGTVTLIPPPSDSEVATLQSPAVAVGVPALKPMPPATQLMLSLSQTDQLETLAQLPVDGVGLIRSELMITPMLQHQSLQQWLRPHQQPSLSQALATVIQQFAQAFAPRPVWYRTLDLRSHEYSHPASATSQLEPNPLLGDHGTMSYQTDPRLFMAELHALKQVQAHGFNNVNILLPFVRTVEEFQFCHQAIQQVGLLDQNSCQVWIMAEVPSVLFLLPDYFAAGVQGLAIGSNDLAQLILAVDRTTATEQMPASNHPAVLSAIERIVAVARQAHIPCMLCGNLASQYPELIDSFVRWGISALSVEPIAVSPVQASIHQAEWQLFQEWKRDRFLT